MLLLPGSQQLLITELTAHGYLSSPCCRLVRQKPLQSRHTCVLLIISQQSTLSRADAEMLDPAGYIMQIFPSLAMMLLKRIGPARARALKEGRDGYAVSELTKRQAP